MIRNSYLYQGYLNLKALRKNEHTLMGVLAIMVGLAGGFGAVGFRFLINFFQKLSYGSAGNLLDVINTLPWYYKFWIPALGGLVVGPKVGLLLISKRYSKLYQILMM